MHSTTATFAFMCSHAAHWLALGFGTGLSPIAPGTIGTLGAWITFNWLLCPWFSRLQIGWLLLGAFALGIWACTKTARRMNTPDPGAIVWDEIVAFWAVLYILAPSDWWPQLWAFVLFRYFDAVKLGPVAWADRYFKGFGWRGGLGIMLDDIAAAVMALLVLWILALGVRFF